MNDLKYMIMPRTKGIPACLGRPTRPPSSRRAPRWRSASRMTRSILYYPMSLCIYDTASWQPLLDVVTGVNSFIQTIFEVPYIPNSKHFLFRQTSLIPYHVCILMATISVKDSHHIQKDPVCKADPANISSRIRNRRPLHM